MSSIHGYFFHIYWERTADFVSPIQNKGERKGSNKTPRRLLQALSVEVCRKRDPIKGMEKRVLEKKNRVSEQKQVCKHCKEERKGLYLGFLREFRRKQNFFDDIDFGVVRVGRISVGADVSALFVREDTRVGKGMVVVGDGGGRWAVGGHDKRVFAQIVVDSFLKRRRDLSTKITDSALFTQE